MNTPNVASLALREVNKWSGAGPVGDLGANCAKSRISGGGASPENRHKASRTLPPDSSAPSPFFLIFLQLFWPITGLGGAHFGISVLLLGLINRIERKKKEKKVARDG